MCLADNCKSNGFIEGLQCSSCAKLPKYGLSELKENCTKCCQKDESSSTSSKHAYGVIEICGWKLSRYPQIEAFVKSDKPNQFPNLEVRYRRGADPTIRLMDENRAVVEELGVEHWNTDTIEEFLKEKL